MARATTGVIGVLIVAGGWHDERPGGANKLPTDFARFLAARGHEVAYVCPSAAVERATTETIDGVDLRRYPAPAAPSPSVDNLRRHLERSREATRGVLAARRIDLLLGHSQLQYFGAAAACPREVRRCYGVHSPFAQELREHVAASPTLRQRLAWRGASWMERRILAMSDLVHCDSAYTRTLMEATYPGVLDGKSVVLPGWVDGQRFRPRPDEQDALRRRLGEPWRAGIPTFFTLRRLVPRMGLDTLIEAVAELAVAGRTFRLVVGGEGQERSRLEALARERGVADRVAFIGRVAEDRLADSYAAADCFVLPTRALECFGLIVLESYASGVPVIGVPVGSIPEVMGPEFAAWIADDNQAPALARRLADVLEGRLAADPGRLRARAMEFDFPLVACRHERVLTGAAVPALEGVSRASR
jgi:glycosyltransferase involved in cell wall biosynthesis